MRDVATKADLRAVERRIFRRLAGLLVMLVGIVVLLALMPTSARAQSAEAYLRSLPAVIETRARAFSVDANVRLGRPQCSALPGGRACVVPITRGIVLNALERGGRVIATQLTVSRANVQDQQDIGRSLNALFLAALAGTDQRGHDIMVMGGATCVMSDFSHKNGPVEFKSTPGGCVITIDR